jgi:putative oxidoreductase
MKNRIIKTFDIPTIILRLVVGLTFLSEGLQKFIYPEILGVGRFEKIGFAHPGFWAPFTGSFEITCGILLLAGLLTRIAAIPLLIIMITAFVTTKVPILVDKDFWSFAHEYRVDFAMTMLLLFLIYYGGGRLSFDKRMFDKSGK